MELAVVLPITLFVALAVLLAFVLQRTTVLVARTRVRQGFQGGVRDLARRVEISLDPVSRRIDAVRRSESAPDTISEALEAAADAVERYAAEARAMRPPRDAVHVRDALVHELERAGRAIAMVEHGVSILQAVRRGGRELEAQTSIKRGYLNLIHAREAIAHQVGVVAQLETDRAAARK
jgi:hypothetical protein